MFGEKYIQEELKKKFESMKQLDRIEFISRVNSVENSVGDAMNALITFLSFGGLLILFGIHFFLRFSLFSAIELNSLANDYLVFGVICVVSSLVVFVVTFYLFFKSEKIEKESNKSLEQFLKERSK